jgi:hypothetical protein
MAAKVTFDTVGKIASEIPGVENSTGDRGFALKAGGRLMACEAIHKSAEQHSLMLRIDMDQRDALIAEAPDIYYVTDHYAPYPAVLVRLSRVTPDAVHDLLRASCRFVTAGKPRKRLKNS